MTAAVDRPSTGIEPPPFFRRIEAPPGTPADALYRLLLESRDPKGVKALNRGNVLPEYEDAWRRIIAWHKSRGLTAREVARAAKSLQRGTDASNG